MWLKPLSNLLYITILENYTNGQSRIPLIITARRNFKKANWQEYTEHIKNSIEEETKIKSLNLTDLEDIINQAANISIPKYKPKPQNNQFQVKPWWKTKCSKAVAQRRLSFKKFRLCMNPQTYSVYKYHVRVAKLTIKKAKEELWAKLCCDLENQ